MADKSTERQAWKFDSYLTNPEQRKARALEYIAYYLDRIEMHMAKIAGAAAEDSPAASSALARARERIAEAVALKEGRE
jgi:hypothetical protein